MKHALNQRPNLMICNGINHCQPEPPGKSCVPRADFDTFGWEKDPRSPPGRSFHSGWGLPVSPEAPKILKLNYFFDVAIRLAVAWLNALTNGAPFWSRLSKVM